MSRERLLGEKGVAETSLPATTGERFSQFVSALGTRQRLLAECILAILGILVVYWAYAESDHIYTSVDNRGGHFIFHLAFDLVWVWACLGFSALFALMIYIKPSTDVVKRFKSLLACLQHQKDAHVEPSSSSTSHEATSKSSKPMFMGERFSKLWSVFGTDLHLLAMCMLAISGMLMVYRAYTESDPMHIAMDNQEGRSVFHLAVDLVWVWAFLGCCALLALIMYTKPRNDDIKSLLSEPDVNMLGNLLIEGILFYGTLSALVVVIYGMIQGPRQKPVFATTLIVSLLIFSIGSAVQRALVQKATERYDRATFLYSMVVSPFFRPCLLMIQGCWTYFGMHGVWQSKFRHEDLVQSNEEVKRLQLLLDTMRQVASWQQNEAMVSLMITSVSLFEESADMGSLIRSIALSSISLAYRFTKYDLATECSRRIANPDSRVCPIVAGHIEGMTDILVVFIARWSETLFSYGAAVVFHVTMKATGSLSVMGVCFAGPVLLLTYAMLLQIKEYEGGRSDRQVAFASLFNFHGPLCSPWHCPYLTMRASSYYRMRVFYGVFLLIYNVETLVRTDAKNDKLLVTATSLTLTSSAVLLASMRHIRSRLLKIKVPRLVGGPLVLECLRTQSSCPPIYRAEISILKDAYGLYNGGVVGVCTRSLLATPEAGQNLAEVVNLTEWVKQVTGPGGIALRLESAGFTSEAFKAFVESMRVYPSIVQELNTSRNKKFFETLEAGHHLAELVKQVTGPGGIALRLEDTGFTSEAFKAFVEGMRGSSSMVQVLSMLGNFRLFKTSEDGQNLAELVKQVTGPGGIQLDFWNTEFSSEAFKAFVGGMRGSSSIVQQLQMSGNKHLFQTSEAGQNLAELVKQVAGPGGIALGLRGTGFSSEAFKAFVEGMRGSSSIVQELSMGGNTKLFKTSEAGRILAELVKQVAGTGGIALLLGDTDFTSEAFKAFVGGMRGSSSIVQKLDMSGNNTLFEKSEAGQNLAELVKQVAGPGGIELWVVGTWFSSEALKAFVEGMRGSSSIVQKLQMSGNSDLFKTSEDGQNLAELVKQVTGPGGIELEIRDTNFTSEAFKAFVEGMRGSSSIVQELQMYGNKDLFKTSEDGQNLAELVKQVTGPGGIALGLDNTGFSLECFKAFGERLGGVASPPKRIAFGDVRKSIDMDDESFMMAFLCFLCSGTTNDMLYMYSSEGQLAGFPRCRAFRNATELSVPGTYLENKESFAFLQRAFEKHHRLQHFIVTYHDVRECPWASGNAGERQWRNLHKLKDGLFRDVTFTLCMQGPLKFVFTHVGSVRECCKWMLTNGCRHDQVTHVLEIFDVLITV